jgi:hypothetical protein
VWSSDLRRALEESFSLPAGRDDANRLLPDGLPHAEIDVAQAVVASHSA